MMRSDAVPTSSSLSSSKLDSPSAQRNKDPILGILSSKVFPLIISDNNGLDSKQPIRVLEVAAGCGVHTEHFCRGFLEQLAKQGSVVGGNDSDHDDAVKSLRWYPTDPDEQSRRSIQCYIDDNPSLSDVVNPPLPLTLDSNGIQEESTSVTLFGSSTESTDTLDLITCINMIHISPWEATLGLFKVAGRSLSTNGTLFCYGPYKEGGTAVQSNLNFDENLKSRNPLWGVRDLESVIEAADQQGLKLEEKIEMPANNLSLLFRRKR